MKDFIGNEIKEGSKIVYPGRSGSSLWMNYAVVMEAKGGKLRVYRLKDKYGRSGDESVTTLSRIDNVVVVG